MKHSEVLQRQECRVRNHHDKKVALHLDFVTLQILATSAQNLMLLGLNTFWAKAQKSVHNHKG